MFSFPAKSQSITFFGKQFGKSLIWHMHIDLFYGKKQNMQIRLLQPKEAHIPQDAQVLLRVLPC